MTAPSPQDRHTIARWRLLLGKEAEKQSLSCAGDAACERIERLVGFLFGESSGGGGQGRTRSGDRSGGLGGGHPLTVPEWVDSVRELFPREAKEVMERELVQRRGIEELLQQPQLLEKVEPNTELVKTLLTHRDLLKCLAEEARQSTVNRAA